MFFNHLVEFFCWLFGLWQIGGGFLACVMFYWICRGYIKVEFPDDKGGPYET